MSGGRVWAETKGAGAGAPDGMKIDGAGNLYCCGPGGIHVFDPQAACLVTASTSIYRLRVNTPGTAQWGPR